MMQIGDDELITGCRAENKTAQRLLFERYNSRMMALCFRYMGDKTRAEDILQEGFIIVFRNIYLFRHEGSFEGWIRRIMVNTALKELRKHTESRLDDYPETFDLHPDFDQVLSNIRVKELLKLVASLPDGYRTVFNLNVIEGFSHQEIAAELGISESTSRTQLFKARMQLQKLIISSESMTEKKLFTGK